jgi:hypothetical protein
VSDAFGSEPRAKPYLDHNVICAENPSFTHRYVLKAYRLELRTRDGISLPVFALVTLLGRVLVCRTRGQSNQFAQAHNGVILSVEPR